MAILKSLMLWGLVSLCIFGERGGVDSGGFTAVQPADWKYHLNSINNNTKRVSFTKWDFTSELVEKLKELTKLESLDLSGVKISTQENWNDLFDAISSTIKTLKLKNTGYQGECLDKVKEFVNLKSLDISDNGINSSLESCIRNTLRNEIKIILNPSRGRQPSKLEQPRQRSSTTSGARSLSRRRKTSLDLRSNSGFSRDLSLGCGSSPLDDFSSTKMSDNELSSRSFDFPGSPKCSDGSVSRRDAATSPLVSPVSSLSQPHSRRVSSGSSGIIRNFSRSQKSDSEWSKTISDLGDTLNELILNGSNYKGQNCNAFSNFVHLEVLNLASCNLTKIDSEDRWDTLFKSLTKGLIELVLSNSNYSGQRVEKFHVWTDLKKLHMTDCKEISVPGWSSLIANIQNNIEKLHLSQSSYNGDNIIVMSRREKLTELDLAGCVFTLDNWKKLKLEIEDYKIHSKPYVKVSFFGKKLQPLQWGDSVRDLPSKVTIEVDFSNSDYNGENGSFFKEFTALKKVILISCTISAENKEELLGYLPTGCNVEQEDVQNTSDNSNAQQTRLEKCCGDFNCPECHIFENCQCSVPCIVQ